MSESEDPQRSPQELETTGLVSRSGRLVLNVGGTLFHTNVDTLTDGSSYFKAILSGSWSDVTVNKDGLRTCFIDADPKAFTHIISHLRTGRMPLFWTTLAGFDLALYSQVLNQAHFFLIEPLIEWIEKAEYRLAVKNTVTAEIYDDESWHVGSKLLTGVADADKIVVSHDWVTTKKYLCPRGIGRHNGKRSACGRACERAKGDDEDEYCDASHCRLLVTRQQTVFNHAALEPKSAPGASLAHG